MPAKRKAQKQQKEEEQQEEEQQEEEEEEDEEQDEDATASNKKKKQKKAAAQPLVLQTEMDVLDRKPPCPDGTAFKILSFNVNGLNALCNKDRSVLQNLVQKEGNDVDVLMLQETKLQESKCESFSNDVLPGYQVYWNCSITKKGYAGTAVFVKEKHVVSGGGAAAAGAAVGGGGGSDKKKQKTLTSFFGKSKETVSAASATSAASAAASSSFSSSGFRLLNVTYGMEGNDEDEEGRIITCEFEDLFVVCVYVVNSGMKLERLDYRLNSFNPQFQKYLAGLRELKPVVVGGDWNVAHLDSDCYNTGAKHLPKVPGLTPQERQAHTKLLANHGWVDTFRYFHPNAKGLYTYWNVKTNARPQNRGLRLDYALYGERDVDGSRKLKLYDAYILHDATVGFSDHAPIGVVLQKLS